MIDFDGKVLHILLDLNVRARNPIAVRHAVIGWLERDTPTSTPACHVETRDMNFSIVSSFSTKWIPPSLTN